MRCAPSQGALFLGRMLGTLVCLFGVILAVDSMVVAWAFLLIMLRGCSCSSSAEWEDRDRLGVEFLLCPPWKHKWVCDEENHLWLLEATSPGRTLCWTSQGFAVTPQPFCLGWEWGLELSEWLGQCHCQVTLLWVQGKSSVFPKCALHGVIEGWKAHIAQHKMSLAAHKLDFECSVKLACFYGSQIYWQTIYRQKCHRSSSKSHFNDVKWQYFSAVIKLYWLPIIHLMAIILKILPLELSVWKSFTGMGMFNRYLLTQATPSQWNQRSCFAISYAWICSLQVTDKCQGTVKAQKEPKIPSISNYSPKLSKLDSTEWILGKGK